MRFVAIGISGICVEGFSLRGVLAGSAKHNLVRIVLPWQSSDEGLVRVPGVDMDPRAAEYLVYSMADVVLARILQHRD